MSDDGQSRDDKGFLARWSQRKREAKRPDREASPSEADAPAEPAAEAEPDFDPSNLPKPEEMTATTDITGFLRKGVPEHIRNAALRKSWALDPAIRNYVNPALDYAYDWNTPGGVPGSSAIGTGMDVARLVSQIMGSGVSAVEPKAAEARSGDEPAVPMSRKPLAIVQRKKFGGSCPTDALRLTGEQLSIAQKASNSDEDAGRKAAQREESLDGDSAAPQQAVRRHGSAKPLD